MQYLKRPFLKLPTIIILGFFALQFTSCVSKKQAYFTLQNQRFLVPESEGETFKGHVAVGLGSRTKIRLGTLDTDLVTGHKSVADNPKIDSDISIFSIQPTVLALMGVHPNLDTFYGPAGLGLKLQVWGSNALEAKEGSQSVAIAVAGNMGKNQSNCDKSLFLEIALGNDDCSPNSDEITTKYKTLDFMGLYGRRLTDNFLLYANLSEKLIWASAKFVATDKNQITSTTNISTRLGHQSTGLGGLQFNYKHLVTSAEAGLVLTQWPHADTQFSYAAGAMVGFKW